MAKILFLTDSAADIPKSLREELGIRVMPFPIAMGERELRDGEDFTPQEFYQALAEEPKIPTHAQLTTYQFQQCYEETWKAGYTDLIYTSINSEGSATYQNAVQARGEFFEDHPEARDAFSIRVIDSHTYTMCYGYPVAEGARMAAAGASVEEIAAYIQDWVDHVRVLFVPFDLKFAKKSGRVSAAAAFVGEALGLKPIMTFENGASKVRDPHHSGAGAEGAGAGDALSDHPVRPARPGGAADRVLPSGLWAGAGHGLLHWRRYRHQRRTQSGGTHLPEEIKLAAPRDPGPAARLILSSRPGRGGRRKESGEEIPGIYILFILFVIGWTMLWKTEGIDVIL